MSNAEYMEHRILNTCIEFERNSWMPNHLTEKYESFIKEYNNRSIIKKLINLIRLILSLRFIIELIYRKENLIISEFVSLQPRIFRDSIKEYGYRIYANFEYINGKFIFRDNIEVYENGILKHEYQVIRNIGVIKSLKNINKINVY